MDKHEAEKLLQTAVGDPHVQFRAGQWEAIDAVVNQRKKTLVVQRTGWGKSSVYFVSTRMLRNKGAGPTIIISPLLALMRNQIDAAARLNINAVTINSTNSDEWSQIERRIMNDEIDALLISPERLSNEKFVNDLLLPISDRIGLMVVDEAHCISDWGHDFRPDYRRLVNVLRQLPPNMPLLGTTATANDRVIKDVVEQFGDVEVHRGTLVRESLSLQNLRLPDQPARLAWLAKHIPELPGTGIIYTLTTRDAGQVAEWLQQQGIAAKAYFGKVEAEGFSTSDAYRQHLEQQLLDNELKVLVATTALGMGYDKPDLGFVIHYQAPSSIVGYYQQVGRAGRAIDSAVGVLLSGKEDAEINEFFRESAFPDQKQVNQLLDELDRHDALSVFELQANLNLRQSQIEKVLKLISVESPAPVIKQGAKWARTAVPFKLDRDRVEHLTRQRELEWQEVQNYLDHEGCLMAFLRTVLDDPSVEDCGRCANCLGRPIVPKEVDQELARAAALFLRQADIPFKPKIQVANGAFPIYGFRGNLSKTLRAQPGKTLSRWADAGWGKQVMDEKHAGAFSDALAEAMAEMYLRWLPEPAPTWVTCVPSQRHPTLVPDLARRVAKLLDLPFVVAIAKVRDNEPQKIQQNRFHQCQNLDGAFEINSVQPGPVLLVDDVIHSGWTLTVLAALLQESGSGPVYPMALATYGTAD